MKQNIGKKCRYNIETAFQNEINYYINELKNDLLFCDYYGISEIKEENKHFLDTLNEENNNIYSDMENIFLTLKNKT